MGKKNETLNLNPKPSQNNSNVRAQWTPQQITIFCEACVDEVFKGNRPTTHFNKPGWRNIEANFKKNTGKEYPRIKFKHKWDTLKKDWVAWNKLKGSETGLGWDATKGTITATDEWWERKLTEVPEAAKFRERGLDNADLLDIMFKDTAATGNLAWAPSSGVLPSDLETPEEGLGDASGDLSSPDDDEVETPSLTQPTQDKGKKRVSISSLHGKRKKGGAATMLTHQLSRICEAVELRNSASLMEPRSSIRDVMERVCTLDGAEKGSDLYLMAARIFQKREKREMFVVMGEPHLQLKCNQMDYDDYVNNSDDDHDNVDDNDDEINELVVAGCQAADCIGAIDGTHIQVVIGEDKKIPYLGRKGVPTQNVMAACDFDLLFTFVMAGWEGAAHDTRIFLETIRTNSVNFPKPPPGKYYLVDAGYPLRNGYLTPYKGEKYHLPDFRRAGRGNKIEERFNYVHSSLRSVIERTFGVWKNKWRILRQMPSYDIEDQRNIVVATCVLHNFIRIHDREDEGFKWDELGSNIDEGGEYSSVITPFLPTGFSRVSVRKTGQPEPNQHDPTTLRRIKYSQEEGPGHISQAHLGGSVCAKILSDPLQLGPRAKTLRQEVHFSYHMQLSDRQEFLRSSRNLSQKMTPWHEEHSDGLCSQDHILRTQTRLCARPVPLKSRQNKVLLKVPGFSHRRCHACAQSLPDSQQVDLRAQGTLERRHIHARQGTLGSPRIYRGQPESRSENCPQTDQKHPGGLCSRGHISQVQARISANPEPCKSRQRKLSDGTKNVKIRHRELGQICARTGTRFEKKRAGSKTHFFSRTAAFARRVFPARNKLIREPGCVGKIMTPATTWNSRFADSIPRLTGIYIGKVHKNSSDTPTSGSHNSLVRTPIHANFISLERGRRELSEDMPHDPF
uniref:Myb/SANT-like domain-containing protein n=1 Tax=Fagus sylvatica TaxID=28930 RepID=A0A2N9FS97_FAGSY